MPEMKEDVEVERQRRTLYLLAGGALSLLLPLLAIAYLKLSDSNTAEPGTTGAAIFAQHAPGSPPLSLPRTAPPASSAASLPAVSPVSKKTMTPVSAGSLGYIRGGADYAQPENAASPPAQQAPPAAAPAPAPAPAQKSLADAQPAPAKPGPKTFVKPKLKPSSGFTSMGKQGSQAGQQGAPGGTPDIQAMMKNLPGGAAGGGQGGMPDMSALMKNMPGGGQGTPDVNQMIQNMPAGQGSQSQ